MHFADVQKAYPEARLDLVGGGPLEAETRRLVADLNLNGVNFTGMASREEIGKYYDDADIFINASRVDNMPVSIIRGLRLGNSSRLYCSRVDPLLCRANGPDCCRPSAMKSARGECDPVAAGSSTGVTAGAECVSGVQKKYTWDAVRGQWVGVYGRIEAV